MMTYVIKTDWAEEQFSMADAPDFSIANVPFGIFSTEAENSPRIGVRVGTFVIDLYELASLGVFDEMSIPLDIFRSYYLNDFIALGKKKTQWVRKWIQSDLRKDKGSLIKKYFSQVTIKAHLAKMAVPIHVGDYTDFYSSKDHAENVGKLFRNPDQALPKNWLHLPVAYHGRSSSIVTSEQSIKRPQGQIILPTATSPVYTYSQKVDFELELAMVVGKDSSLGHAISTEEAKEYIFGYALFNDWSARDIQQWEYVPLGPFLGKSFASSISPWIVTAEALESLRVAGPKQIPAVLPYLQYTGHWHFDLALSVEMQTHGQGRYVISETSTKYLYWNSLQLISHHTSNGCNIRIGDVLASGTISGREPSTWGSLLELTYNGSQPIALADDVQRTFLEDGDTVIFQGSGVTPHGQRIGFGELKNQLVR